MSRRILRTVRPCAAVVALIALGSAALAGGSALQLNWNLVGPAINGVVPSGKASLDQSQLPGQLKVEVKGVNLPDGTSLVVSVAYSVVGTLNLSGGQAKLQTTVPFQVRADPFDILYNGAIIMTGQPVF